MDSKAIITRLKQVLQYYSLTSSTFADSINVQRSSISHLMSGRNKPSLDFVLKVTDRYPEVDLYWLLNGKGEFPKKNENEILNKKSTEQDLFSTDNNEEVKKSSEENIKLAPSLFDENSLDDIVVKKKSNKRFSDNDKKIIKVILFYEDGSFDVFKN